ncbi:site-specific DNA-methyltransferase [bacterium]|nr:site-specific DNA-methyltransferase [bacterium]
MAILNFKGKTFVQNHHLAVKFHQLVPKKDKSLTDKASLNDNLIINGDNLKALKALLPTYAGKVKCIYIDPPYNTGNEKWAYNDNVNSPMMQEWLGKVVDREDLTRHDKWLCMMMPRLKLLRELLREDGVIFISIDDNEIHHLRMVMDEIFGEEQFKADICWQKRYTRSNNTVDFTAVVEHILVYAKSESFLVNLLPRTDEADARYSNPDKDPRGPWKGASFLNPATPIQRPNLCYPIENPNTGKITNPTTNAWRRSREEFERLKAEDFLYWGPDGKQAVPVIKVFLSNVRGLTPTNFWPYDYAGSTDDGTRDLETLLPGKIFNNPKPIKLIKRILEHASDKDSLILDSFGGSGTTAHAVLDLNKEDGGNRKFILVECEDYADKITAERVRRIIKGVKGAKDEKLKEGLGGSFSFFELGDPIEMESILEGKKLPSYLDLARYVFYTATGEEFDPKKVNEKKNFIGESREYEAYLFYKPDIEYLKRTALNLDLAKSLGEYKGKKRLVFAPSKYLDTDYLLEYRIEYCQLPFEIYKLKG